MTIDEVVDAVISGETKRDQAIVQLTAMFQSDKAERLMLAVITGAALQDVINKPALMKTAYEYAQLAAKFDGNRATQAISAA